MAGIPEEENVLEDQRELIQLSSCEGAFLVMGAYHFPTRELLKLRLENGVSSG